MPSDVSASVSSEELIELQKMTAAELINTSRRALESQDWTHASECLAELRSLLVHPAELSVVLDSDLRTLLKLALASDSPNIATMALTVLTDCLQAMSALNMAEGDSALVKVVLRLIRLDVILVATSSDIRVPAFEALTWWCSQGRKHRKFFLEVMPMDFLDVIYTKECPSDMFIAYVELIASIIRHGNDANGVLPAVLRIFARAVRDHGVGTSCEVAEKVCDAMTNVFRDFEGEHVVEEVLDSRLAAALVRHVMALPTYVSPGACLRTCLSPMMNFLVNMTCSSEEHCERFIDQGISQVIEVSLAGQNLETSRFACMVLTNAFAYSSFSIEFALHSTLAKRLLELRESPDEGLRQEALRAASNFFSKASYAQIFAMIKMGYVPEIVKVLRSPYAEAMSNGVQSLLALICATNYTDPMKLPALHEQLSKHDVAQLTEVLQYHKVKQIRLAAMSVNKFMQSYLDEEKLRSGAIPKWSGISRSPSQADLQSVLSLPM